MTSTATRLADGVFVALGASRGKCYSVPVLTFIRYTSRSIENKLLIGAVANAVAQGVGRGPEHAGLVVLVSLEIAAGPLFHLLREVFCSFHIEEKSTDTSLVVVASANGLILIMRSRYLPPKRRWSLSRLSQFRLRIGSSDQDPLRLHSPWQPTCLSSSSNACGVLCSTF
jgi:hypothetical protein